MQVVSVELAERILKTLEAGASNATTTLTEVLNEFINYLIFVEAMNASRFLLAILAVFVIRKAFALFVAGTESETTKNQIRGGGVLLSLLVMSVSLMWSWQSFLSLGKVIFAPKVYLIEMAYEKVQAIRAVGAGK